MTFDKKFSVKIYIFIQILIDWLKKNQVNEC